MAVSKANILDNFTWFKDLQDTANEEKFVQKEEGKQLSSNDFSDADKAKLDSLANFEPATATKLGGIKVGNGLEVEDDGTLNVDYDLPTASATTKGGVKVGSGLTMYGETLTADQYDLPTASKTRKGGIKVGDGLDMDGETLKCTVEPGITNLVSHTQNGIMRATDKVKLDTIEDYAQVNTIERIKVNNSTLTITNKTVDIDLSGYVQGVNIAGAYHYKGTVNSYANLPTSGQVAGDVYNVRTAGGQDINGDDIKAGDNVAWTGVGWDVLAGTVDLSKFVEKVPGKDLSTEDFTTALKSKLEGLSNYSLPTASATTKGGVKIGTGLQMSGETLNAIATNYALPTASTTEKGGIKVGLGLRMNGETLNATATDYTLPTASSSTKGGVKVGTGLNMNGETLNCTIQGGTKVIAGTGLAFSNDTLNVTMTAGTNIVAGTGLSFSGDTLNCTLSGGGGTYADFTGASANFGGASGLVPSPAAGDNANFLRGDGTWAPATQNITVYSAAVTVPPSPQGYDGALWEDTLSNGDPVLKLRYGDYEFNFNYDTKNYTGTTPPPITPEDAQLYMLDTVPSTDEGTLWYNVTQSNFFPIPALCLHAGSFDYGYNYDTITYKGGNTGLVAYLPLQTSIDDAMGNTVTSKGTPVIEPFTINGETHRGMRNINAAASGTGTVSTEMCTVTLSTPPSVYTVDWWFTVLPKNTVNVGRVVELYQTGSTGAQICGYTASNGKLAYASQANNGTAPNTGYGAGRYHVAITQDGTYVRFWINGKLVGSSGNYRVAILNTCSIFNRSCYRAENTTAYCYVDHLRIWNKVVWDGDFEVPKMSDY